MKHCKRKLRSRAGETLAETLAALLVGVIALAILAGTIMSAFNLIRNSRTYFGEYSERNNALNSMETSAGAPATIEIKEEEEGAVPLRLTDAQTEDEIKVYYYTNGKAAAYRIK